MADNPLALLGGDDDEEMNDLQGSEDYSANAPVASAGGLSALDVPGAAQALATLARSSAQARAALQDARKQITARRYSRSVPLLALSSALSKPTRFGTVGEVFGNVSEALQGPTKERAAFEANKTKELLGIDTQLAGLDQSEATAQLQLAALRAKLGQQYANAPLEKVVRDGKVYYSSRPEARGAEAWTPPGAQTNVSVGTDKSLYGTMAEQMGKQYIEQYTAAQQAPKQIERSQRVLDLLDKGAYTGAGAQFKLLLDRGAKAMGLDFGGTEVENTEQLASELANSTLGMIRASGLGGGTGFSNADREFVEKAAGGSITLNKNTLARLARLNMKAQQNVMQTWNEAYGRLDPKMLRQMGMIQLDVPALGGEQSDAAIPDQVAPAPPAGEPAPQSDAAPYGYAPAAWAVDPANPPPRASPTHEAALKANPDRAQEFLEKFGYLPQ